MRSVFTLGAERKAPGDAALAKRTPTRLTGHRGSAPPLGFSLESGLGGFPLRPLPADSGLHDGRGRGGREERVLLSRRFGDDAGMRVPVLLAALSLLAIIPGCPRPEEATRDTLSTGRAPAPDASGGEARPAPAEAPALATGPAVAAPVGGGTPSTPPASPAPAAKAGDAPSTGCKKDEDCAATRAQPEGCCEGCEVRAVPSAELSAREARCARQALQCPELPCAPPRFSFQAVCEAGTCVLKRERAETQ